MTYYWLNEIMLKFFKVANEEEYEDVLEDENNIVEEEVGQIALDILETRDEMLVVAPVAWIELDDIDILFDDWVLTIKWERNMPDVYSSNAVLKNSECFWGKFSRNIILPENLDFESIRASLDNGVLAIHIPKLKFSSQSIKIEQV